MPDLTNDPIAANYRIAEQKFSNFGTRRLRFYTVEVYGYNIYTSEDFTEGYDWNFETTGINGDDGYYAYKNQSGSIIEAILRGAALVAETYYVSWWEVYNDGGDYTTITLAVAGDTFLDGVNQYLQPNSNAYSLVDAIADAMGNDFEYDYINVYAQEIHGNQLEYDSDGPPYALNRTAKQLNDEQKAARAARIADPKAKIARRR